MTKPKEKKLLLKSVAFKDGEYIPEKHTCDGDDTNPFLEVAQVPERTSSLALIVDDPDAPHGLWTHWLLFNIDPKTRYIEEDAVPFGALQGTTSFKETKYGGPCPPKGHDAHRYNFTLYALDSMLALKEGATRDELESAMNGHIIAESRIIGLYKRRLR